jgi:Cysteine-rich CWC
MSVECSMFAISAERFQALRGNPAAIKDEVILRQALDHLAVMSVFKRCMSEREVLAQIRVCQRNVDMIDNPTMRRQIRHERLTTAWRKNERPRKLRGRGRFGKSCFEEAKMADGKICCPSCGSENDCGMAKGEATCWCFAMPHLLPVSAADEAARCYCRACLTQLIAERTRSGTLLPDRP